MLYVGPCWLQTKSVLFFASISTVMSIIWLIDAISISVMIFVRPWCPTFQNSISFSLRLVMWSYICSEAWLRFLEDFMFFRDDEMLSLSQGFCWNNFLFGFGFLQFLPSATKYLLLLHTLLNHLREFRSLLKTIRSTWVRRFKHLYICIFDAAIQWRLLH